MRVQTEVESDAPPTQRTMAGKLSLVAHLWCVQIAGNGEVGT